MYAAVISDQDYQFPDKVDSLHFSDTNTLLDYDVVYVYPSVNWTGNSHVSWTDRIDRLLQQDKTVAIFYDSSINFVLGRIKYLPIAFSEGSGKNIQYAADEHWRDFYKSVIKTYSNYVDISVHDASSLTPLLGLDDTKIIAFKHSDYRLYLIPRIAPDILFNPSSSGVESAILKLISQRDTGSQRISPAWADASEFIPNQVSVINEQTKSKSQDIIRIQEQIFALETTKQELLEWRKLLYEGNEILEDVVNNALTLLGIKVQVKYDDGTNELEHVFTVTGKSFVGDSKGKSKALQKDDISQLEINTASYQAAAEIVVDGKVIFLNHFRNKVPHQRGEPADQNLVKLAEKFHIKIISTVQLYKIVKSKLDGNENVSQILQNALISKDYGIIDLNL